MEPQAVAKWLDCVMEASNVTGAMMIDMSSGHCLGARGKATEEDATYISVASRSALDPKGVGVVVYKDSKVILRKGNGFIMIAVFKEMDSLEESPDET
ncbi:hypothetical protein DFP73DRAFT_599883 [Morchella snyderi]|nr:hypothetical protein DFP73DRAFT_599883 [Morchella snyderi]